MVSVVLVCVMALFVFVDAHGSDSEGHAHLNRVAEGFNLKPNGQTATATATLFSAGAKGKDLVCKFTYAVVGGTNEDWEISLEKEGSGYMCTVHRPDKSSYLFFQHFTFEFEGRSIQDAIAYNGNSELKPSEFKISGSQMKSTEQFKSGISRVHIISD